MFERGQQGASAQRRPPGKESDARVVTMNDEMVVTIADDDFADEARVAVHALLVASEVERDLVLHDGSACLMERFPVSHTEKCAA